jgi:hypothetical protein
VPFDKAFAQKRPFLESLHEKRFSGVQVRAVIEDVVVQVVNDVVAVIHFRCVARSEANAQYLQSSAGSGGAAFMRHFLAAMM